MQAISKKMILFLVLAIAILSISTYAQKNNVERLLFCNERDSVHDRYSYPRDSGIVKTRNGAIRYLEWRGFIGNQKGNYKLRISSYSNFGYKIQTRKNKRGARWQTVASGRNALTATSGGNRFFKYDRLFKSSGFFSDGYRLAIFVYPLSRRANVSVSWYTTGCEKSKPRRNRTKCVWNEEGGLFGIPGSGSWVCRCGGRVSNARRCGPKPRRSSFLNLINTYKPANKYLYLNKQNKNLFG